MKRLVDDIATRKAEPPDADRNISSSIAQPVNANWQALALTAHAKPASCTGDPKDCKEKREGDLMPAPVLHAQDGMGSGKPAVGNTVQPKEDWNFTPADYGALTKGKGRLKFDSDSDWFTDPFKENLLSTLKFTLDPTRKKQATQGVSVIDFYHGHVVVKGTAPERLKDLSDEYSYIREEAEEKFVGDSQVKLTQKNLPKFAKAMQASLPSATALLKDAAENKDVAVVYHTFEHTNPHKLSAGSPQRNYMTPMGGSPAEYSPPDRNNASSVYKDYTQLLQFSFLIDQNGVIHVRPGSHNELSTVTGKPESDLGTK